MALLDSRLSRLRVTHPVLPLERVYCANCGKPKGWVSIESGEYIRINQVIVICDDCNITLGELPLLKADIEEI